MPIKTILLPLGEHDANEGLLDTAFALASRFVAHLDVLHVRPDPTAMLPYATLGLSASMRKTVTQAAEQGAVDIANALREQFQKACERNAVATNARGNAPGETTAAWLEESGRQDEVVGRLGRLADLIVIPRPDTISPPPRTVDAALRETGRPVIFVPPKDRKPIGEHVVIGWNGSKEAAQAMVAARPCLENAQSVTVLTTEKRLKLRPSAHDVVVYLACHGIHATAHIMDTSSRSVPEALLEDARSMEADLMVLGGYSRTRVREMIMGGVTRYVFSKADIPVLMVH